MSEVKHLRGVFKNSDLHACVTLDQIQMYLFQPAIEPVSSKVS